MHEQAPKTEEPELPFKGEMILNKSQKTTSMHQKVAKGLPLTKEEQEIFEEEKAAFERMEQVEKDIEERQLDNPYRRTG